MAAPHKNKATVCAVNMDCDILTTEDCSGSEEEEEKAEEEASEDVGPGFSQEFRTLWEAASKNPYNFNGWTKLVAHAEREKNMAACRKAYDKFLMHFPFCHIYWKKYADLEQNLGNAEEAEQVFARALKSNPVNVTLWVDYIQFLMKSMTVTTKKSVDKLQGVFKEAVQVAGLEFYSDELWKLYIDFEINRGNLKQAAELYDRVLSIPTQLYESHYQRFKEFVDKHSPIELLSTVEREWIHSRIQLDTEDNQVASEDTEDAYSSLTENDLRKFREEMLKLREQLYTLNEENVKKRQPFEEEIKRRYFFAAPLNIKQVQNWRKYLEFEISQKQHERIVFLYERCLMSCALFEEFWLSYAQYMERHSVEEARSVFERACLINLPLKYSLHLQWASFEEKHGCLESARTILRNLERAVPGLAVVRLKRVGLEQRSGNLQEAENLLKNAVQISQGTNQASFYSIKLSRLILKLQKDPDRAKAVLIEALEKQPNNAKLHMCLLDIEMSINDDMDAPLICFEKALKCNLPAEVKRILCHRRLEYLEDCSNSLTSWWDAFSEHQNLWKKEPEQKDNKGNKHKKVKTDTVSEDDGYAPGASSPSVCLFNTASLMEKQGVSTANTSAKGVCTADTSVTSGSMSAESDPVSSSSVPLSDSTPTCSSTSSSAYAASTSKPVERPFTPTPRTLLPSPTQRAQVPQTPPQRAHVPQAPPQRMHVPSPPSQRMHVPPPPPPPPFNPYQRTYGPPANVPMPLMNQFPPPGPPMPQDFQQQPFRSPLFFDNQGMPYRMPSRMPSSFVYSPWFQNFGGQPWNNYF